VPVTKGKLATRDARYTERLLDQQSAWWKRALDVQRPYRWNLRRLGPAFTLEIGSGVGRNLAHLRGQAVGVDHNPHSVAECRAAGHLAFTPEEFFASQYAVPGVFDTLLFAHVAEHMTYPAFTKLLLDYVAFVNPQGQLIVITPQEAGFRSDPTHVEFMDFAKIRSAAARVGFAAVREYSFPFPRVFGKVFRYNEFVSVSRRAISVRPA
jgi:SAM-dependent methyltransferase